MITLVVTLAIYLLGAVLFLIFFRKRVLAGWFQALVSAMAWPMLGIVILVEVFRLRSGR